MKAARILLVDDNRSGLLARRAVLEELGYSTEGASDGATALTMFGKQQFDLVVTDFRMPDMDGVELISKLRAMKPELPVILISGFVEALGLSEQTTGANTVIMKSSNEVQHLVRSANRLLRLPKKPAASERVFGRAKRKASSQ
ncbi:MAG: response regulator [Acidobacteria bacterium]|nr:response regulator [Acidobacteriota bacterium]